MTFYKRSALPSPSITACSDAHLKTHHFHPHAYFHHDIFVLTLSLKLKKVRLRTTFASADTSYSTVQLSCCEHYGNVLNEYSEPELKAVSAHSVGR